MTTPHPTHPRGSAGNAALLRAFIVRTLLLAGIWWVLAGAATDAWLVGSVTVLLATAVSVRLQPPESRRFSIPGATRFLAFFIVRSVKGGVQVAAMAFSRKPGLHPALLEIPLRLDDEAERIILAGTLSLLPGTLNVDLQEDRLYLHVLDHRMPIENEVRHAEEMVAQLFGKELR